MRPPARISPPTGVAKQAEGREGGWAEWRLGAKVEMLMRFKENPEGKDNPMCPPGSEEKIMHSCFKVGDTAVMASDGYAKGNPEFKGFSLSITAETVLRVFAAIIYVSIATFVLRKIGNGARAAREISEEKEQEPHP